MVRDSLFPQLIIGLQSLLLVLALLLSAPAAADNIEASVDRNRLSENESVRLFLQAPGLNITGEPDLSGLYQDFEILAQQTRTHIQIINGENQSSRIWEVTLQPKRTGTLIIPEIRIGDSRSQPITLEVREQQNTTQASADVFLHSEIDNSGSIYVQQQLIYTLRLYYATSISDHGLTDLKLDNVLMVQLGNRKDFEARIDNRVYNVAEWQFALYPQSSGELIIPPQTFSGRVRTQNSYSLGGLKHVRIQGPEHRVQVKPIPEQFPDDAQWLPAKSVTLSQQWSGDYTQWQEGKPRTRQLTLEAQGLTAAQLPPVAMADMSALRQYPEQPKLEDQPVRLNQQGAGLVGRKTLSIALIPTQAGDLQLPEVRIPWWNTQTDQLQYASLDALELDISPDPNRKPETQPEPNHENPAPAVTSDMPDNRLYWQISTLVFVLLSALLAGLVWRNTRTVHALKKQLSHHGASTTHLASQPAPEENPIFRQALLNACRQHQARAAWDVWQKWQACEVLQTSAEFDQSLYQLQQTLFGPQAAPQNWDGRNMAEATKGVSLKTTQKTPPLPNLYPQT